MEAAQKRRWLITAVAAVIVVAAVFFYYTTSEPEVAEQRSFSVNTVDTSALECPRNDKIFVAQPQVADSSLPSSPTQAIQSQVTGTYGEITPGALDQTETTADSQTYQFAASGDTLAEVELKESDGGWALESFAACNSFIADQVPGDPR